MTAIVLGSIGIVAAVFGILFFLGCKKVRYFQDIIYLEELIKKSKLTRENFNKIYNSFYEIAYNNKDRARTKKAFRLFELKYHEFWDEIILEDTETVKRVSKLKNEILK